MAGLIKKYLGHHPGACYVSGMIVLTDLFIVFFVLWCISWITPPAAYPKASHVFCAICVGILGWVIFAKELNH